MVFVTHREFIIPTAHDFASCKFFEGNSNLYFRKILSVLRRKLLSSRISFVSHELTFETFIVLAAKNVFS